MSIIFAIDPGPEQSAFVVWDGEMVQNRGILPNKELLSYIRRTSFNKELLISYTKSFSEPQVTLVIEQISSYGMAVGESVFETVFWSGRFVEAWEGKFVRVKRREIKMHLCGSMQAKDCNVRRALLDRFGLPPTKKKPNPVYGGFKISKDLWQAWALAVFVSDTKVKEIENG